MSKWYKNPLEKIADIRLSNVDKKIIDGEVPVRLCNYMDAYSNDYLDERINYSQGSVKLTEIERFGLLQGDVVITKDSETPDDIAVSAVVVDKLENVICGYHLAILRPQKDILDGVFLMNALREHSTKQWFVRKANGITRYGLSKSSIENVEVNYPDVFHQRKIARILVTIDTVIKQTETTIDKLKKIKQGMMHDLFTSGIDVKTGQLRPPQSEAPELYKQSPIGWIPIGWECDTTENISKRIWIGLVTTMTTHYVEDGIPLIRNNNIKDNEIDVSDIIFLDRHFSEQNKQRYLHKGDVVTVHTGDIGTSAIIPDRLDPAHGFATINTTLNEKIVLNSYLCDYFNTPIFKNRIEAYATGDGRSNFNLYDYLYINIPFPKLLDEQTAISAKLKSINDLLGKEDRQLRKIVKLKQGLMQDLLTGKVEVTPDPQDKAYQGVN